MKLTSIEIIKELLGEKIETRYNAVLRMDEMIQHEYKENGWDENTPDEELSSHLRGFKELRVIGWNKYRELSSALSELLDLEASITGGDE